MIELFDSLCLKTKIAALCFVLGKLTFMPSAYFLFAGQKDIALISICIYAFLIASSLVLSISAARSKSIDTSILDKKIKFSEESENTFTVTVKDGKIISVS